MNQRKAFYFASLSACNENCLFCTRKGDSPPLRTLTTQECKEKIAKAAKEGYTDLEFDGGEPTLREDLPQLIRFGEEVGFRKIIILTNGVKFSEKNFSRKIVSAFRQAKPVFCVSLHSHQKEISEYLVQTPDTFEKTLKGIKNLLNLKAKVVLYHIITKQNYQKLAEFVEFVNFHFPQIKDITFSFIYPAGAALKNKQIFPKLSKVEPFLLRAFKLCEKKNIFFNLTSCGMVPLCFLKGYEHYLVVQQILDQPQNVKIVDPANEDQYQLATENFHQQTKIKSVQCKSCLLNKFCAGLWKFYVGLYGLNELRPIKDKKTLKKVEKFSKKIQLLYGENN